MSYLGEDIKKLGFGLMRLPKIGEAIDIGQTKKMADLFMDAGFTYFDTAWAYPGSEDAIRQALIERYPRDRFTIATKNACWKECRTREDAVGQFETSLKQTGAGYFDFYLLHNLGEARTKAFDDFDMWNFVLQKKKEGMIRHIGFSFHDKAAVLEEILKKHADQVDFVQLQINYADWNNPAVESRKCYETARRFGKPVVIMEPVKGGTLAKLPQDVEDIFKKADPDASSASWAIRFAASLDGVITVLSGMSNIDQMQNNLSYMKDFKKLTDAERKVIEDVRTKLESYRSIPCTSCGYCMKGCPQKIAIPGIFDAMNLYKMYGDRNAARGKFKWNTDGVGLAKGSACIRCGACEKVCPQHLKIRDLLAETVPVLEENGENEKK